MQEQLTAINLALCDAYGETFAVRKPHQLTLIAKQHKQLSKRSRAEQASHAAYMVHTLKPFAANNGRTAVAYIYHAFPELDDSTRQTVAGMIKHGADVQTIAECIA